MTTNTTIPLRLGVKDLNFLSESLPLLCRDMYVYKRYTFTNYIHIHNPNKWTVKWNSYTLPCRYLRSYYSYMENEKC